MGFRPYEELMRVELSFVESVAFGVDNLQALDRGTHTFSRNEGINIIINIITAIR